ncbi:MAG: hypothetical protein WC815_23475 [Vicinamibacterales bacterium]|jgi:hypothetical protein
MRRLLTLVFVAWTASAADALAQPGELIERTLAIVGTQVITLGDARAAVRLGLVDAAPSADAAGITQPLVDRELVLREVQRYAPPAPSESAVDARLDDIRKRVAGAAEMARVLDETGFTEARLRAWVRDDLRAVAYLAQRFASASTPTDTEISAAYTRQRAEFDRAGTTFEQAAPILRERLVVSRRRELIADWVSDLRRRTDVVILVQ